MRGYVTGSTDTSLWTVYNKGARNYCGNVLRDGMLNQQTSKLDFFSLLTVSGLLYAGLVKNQKLSANILTPTTKAADHDVPVTPEEVFTLLHFYVNIILTV